MVTPVIDWTSMKTNAFERDPFSGLPFEVELPALPAAVTRLIECSRDPEVTIQAMAGIIETDSGLTAELLKYVNSNRFRLLRQISRVPQAVAQLGIKATTAFVIGAGAQASMRSFQCRLISPTCHWNESLQKALFAREVANQLCGEGDIAFGAALLQDFILPVLTNAFTKQYFDYQQRIDEWETICEFERQTFGFDHAQVGAHIADQWNFPDELICCILHHHHIATILRHPVLSLSTVIPVALSGLLPSQIGQVPHGAESLAQLHSAVDSFDLIRVSEVVDDELKTAAVGKVPGFLLTEQLLPLINPEADSVATV